jgi:hypothetical protein
VTRAAVNGDGGSHVPRALVLPAARLVDVAGAARYLGVSRRSVFRMRVRALRLDVRDLERLVDAGKVGS